MRDIKVGKIIRSDIGDKAEKFTWVPMTEEQAKESFKRLDHKLQKEMLLKQGYTLEGAREVYMERAEGYQTPQNALATRVARNILDILEN